MPKRPAAPVPPSRPAAPARRLFAMAVLGALVGGVAGTGALLARRTTPPPGGLVVPAAPANVPGALSAGGARPLVDPAPATAPAEPIDGVSVGPKAAKVTVYEFADFQCPACRMVNAYFIPAFLQAYVQTNKVRFVFVNYPLVEIHANAFEAARAGLCADAQGKFDAFRDAVYADQPVWSHLPAPEALVAFKATAARAGVAPGPFATCMASDRFRADVQRSIAAGQRLNIHATPTFAINGRVVVGSSGKEIVDAVDAAIAAAR